MFYHQSSNSLPNSYNTRFYDNIHWPIHFHKSIEIIYVISGEVICNIRGESKTLSAGEFGICLSNELHSYQSDIPSKSWVMVFSEDLVPSFSKLLQKKQGDKISFRCSKEADIYLRANLITDENINLLRLKSCLYTLASEYLSSVKLIEKSNSDFFLANRISDFVGNHFTENISLSMLAKELNYNYSYISRKFEQLFSMSFSSFVNNYRIEHAILLLETTDKKLSDIAFESGFQSVRNFNCVFKESTGTTPKKHLIARQNAKNNKF